jgi:hypothetical protein
MLVDDRCSTAPDLEQTNLVNLSCGHPQLSFARRVALRSTVSTLRSRRGGPLSSEPTIPSLNRHFDQPIFTGRRWTSTKTQTICPHHASEPSCTPFRLGSRRTAQSTRFTLPKSRRRLEPDNSAALDLKAHIQAGQPANRRLLLLKPSRSVQSRLLPRRRAQYGPGLQ